MFFPAQFAEIIKAMTPIGHRNHQLCLASTNDCLPARPKGKRNFSCDRYSRKRGLSHIKDVARRITEGFIALAPDALSPQGGTPENRKMLPMFQN